MIVNRLQQNKYQRNLFHKPTFFERHIGLIFVVALLLAAVFF